MAKKFLPLNLVIVLLGIASFCLNAMNAWCGSPQKPKILLGSVVQQNPDILEAFLQSASHLSQEGYILDYFFIDPWQTDQTKQLLAQFQGKQGRRCLIANETNVPTQPGSWIWKLADFKDRMIAKAREEGYEFLFMVDSDIVVHPKTIEQLIQADKDIISNIFWTDCGNGPIPQVWLYHPDLQYEPSHLKDQSNAEHERCRQEFFEQLKIPGIYEVGGLGACTLFSKNALHKGISFQKLHNVSFYGEDRHFCIRAEALGIPLYVDTHLPGCHIFPNLLPDCLASYLRACENKTPLPLIPKSLKEAA
jgi:hypothetical protein